MYANYCAIENNVIHDGNYSGISVGWKWDYSYHITHDISIKNNLVYDIGQGVLSDLGGIYTLGTQPGTVIENNVIHDVTAHYENGTTYGFGIYLDQGSSYMTVKSNLVYNCSETGYFLHMGKDIDAVNNIYLHNSRGVSAFSKTKAWLITSTRNTSVTLW